MISIILPTYNEAENVPVVTNSVSQYIKKKFEVVVVDDDSPDKTWQVVRALRKGNVRVIRRVNERGLASALARGVSEAKGSYVVWMDCDMTHHPKYLPSLLTALDNGFDVAIGSRYVKGGKDNRGFVRVLTSTLFNFYTNLLLGFKLRDFDTGYVAAKKHVFGKVRIYTKGHGEYCIRFLYDCLKAKFRIVELPVVYEDRTIGKSKTSENLLVLLRHGFNYGIEILRIRFGR